MITCTSCGTTLDAGPGAEPLACIAGEICGDEYVESYFFCPACDTYTVEVFMDRFLAGEGSATRGPLSRAKGDEFIALIRRCPDPSDKKCRCEAHRRYFDGMSVDSTHPAGTTP